VHQNRFHYSQGSALDPARGAQHSPDLLVDRAGGYPSPIPFPLNVFEVSMSGPDFLSDDHLATLVQQQSGGEGGKQEGEKMTEKRGNLRKPR